MSAGRRSGVLPLLVVPLLLVACASSPPAASPAPPAASPTAAASPTPVTEATWHRFSTESGMASISIPPTWTVEGGAVETHAGGVQWIWVRNSLRHEMALLAIGKGGDRGGACDDWDGDGTAFVPARIHLVEEVDVTGETLGDGPPAYLYAATVQPAEGDFSFHVGYSTERPGGDRMPCLIYDDVAVPEGFPSVTLGTPPATIGGGLWQVDSFDAGAAYAETDEYAALVDVLRSLRLEAAR
ncbi:MAG: hypothetical protein ACQEWM_03180 [Actinomycetota bacterium]